MEMSEPQMNASMYSPVTSPTTKLSTTREWVEYAAQNGLLRTIPYSEFSDVVHLTRGGFGTILVASWRRVKVALKKLEVEAMEMAMVVKEIQLMRRSDGNEHIIRMYGVSEHPHTKEFIIVMQYAAKGTLREYLRSKRLDWPAKIKIATQIAKGLEFIHLEGIAHRDLHSKNILVDANDRILIADFGIAKKVDATAAGFSAVVGIPQYIPPERFTKPKGYKMNYQMGDIYALGLVFWELSSCRAPWEDCESFLIIKYIYEEKREDPIDGTPVDYVRLYQRCWAQEPEDRPTVCEVLEGLDSISLDLFVPSIPSEKLKDRASVGPTCLDPFIPGAPSEIDSDSAISSMSSITVELDEISKSLDPFRSKADDTSSGGDMTSPALEDSPFHFGSKTIDTEEYSPSVDDEQVQENTLGNAGNGRTLVGLGKQVDHGHLRRESPGFPLPPDEEGEGTSSRTEYTECPVCGQAISVTEIEVHVEEELATVDRNLSESSSRGEPTEITTLCPLCSCRFSEQEILVHASGCMGPDLNGPDQAEIEENSPSSSHFFPSLSHTQQRTPPTTDQNRARLAVHLPELRDELEYIYDSYPEANVTFENSPFDLSSTEEHLPSADSRASPALEDPPFDLVSEEYSPSDNGEASPALENLPFDVFNKPDQAEPEVINVSSTLSNKIWTEYKPDETDFVYKPNHYQSSSSSLQLLVFGKEVVQVDVPTGVPTVITESIPKMNFAIGSRAVCTAGSKVYFIANKSGNDCLMSYDLDSLEVRIEQGGRWDNTKSLTFYKNCIYSCGKRLHKIEIVYGRSTQIDTKGDIASKMGINHEHSAIVGNILYFSETSTVFLKASLRLWALHLADPNGRFRLGTLLKPNIVALFAWESRLCSLSADGEIAELDVQSGEEVRTLSEDGGSPSACAVWGSSLFVVEQSGRLREINLVTGVGRVIRYLQDVGKNVKSMVVV